MASTAATARPAGVGSCLVCTAGLLGTSKRIAIGRALSRETGMRVFEDSCFVKLLQDAWLQEELGRQEKLGAGAPEKFLAELFRSRGRGTDTPFSPEAQIILISSPTRAPRKCGATCWPRALRRATRRAQPTSPGTT